MVDQDKHMRFTRLVKSTRWLLALLLVGFVTAQGGCELPPCPAGTIGPFDNRDGQVNPNNDADYYCFKVGSSSPPPEPPYLGADLSHAYVDQEGPRDRNAVAISAIVVESCIHDLLIPEFNVNTRIDAIYNTTMKSAIERTMAQETECLSKANSGRGCERVIHCLGIATTPDEPAFVEGCTGDTAMRRRVSPSGTVHNDWFYCPAMNLGDSNHSLYLECYSTPYPRCDTSRKTCTSDSFSSCESNTPRICEYSEQDGESFTHVDVPVCAHKTVCTVDGDKPFCTGAGPACSTTFARPGAENVHLDFRGGVACEDESTLRACVNGHETSIDCTTLGQTFKCIGGSQPHCGADFQCDYEGLFPMPTCDGPFITVCNGGAFKTIDCRTLGFETCDPERGVCK